MRSFPALFTSFTLRHLQRRPFRALLTATNLALGVALALAVLLVNRSILGAFERALEGVAGKATLVVTAGESGLPQGHIAVIGGVPGVRFVTPLVEGRAFLAGRDDALDSLTVFGVSLSLEAMSRAHAFGGGRLAPDLARRLGEPDTMLVTEALARRRGLALGAPVELATTLGQARFTVRGILAPSGPAAAYGGALAIVDLRTAQRHFGKQDRIDRLDVFAAPGTDPDSLRRAILARTGDGLFVERPETRGRGVEGTLFVYRLLLSLFAALAILHGLVLIAGTVRFDVATRRPEIGTLRALGATRATVFALFAGEGLLVGIAGAAIGVALGGMLATGLASVAQRALLGRFRLLLDLEPPLATTADRVTLLLAVACAAFLAAALPALRAARLDPAEAMAGPRREPAASRSGRGLAIGLILLGALLLSALLHLAARGVAFAVLELAAAVAALAILTPPAVSALLRALQRLAAWSGGGSLHLACQELARLPGRTAHCARSIALGMCAVVVMATVNESLERAMLRFHESAWRGDILVAAHGRIVDGMVPPLDASLGGRLAELPGLREPRGIEAMRLVPTRYGGHPIGLRAIDEPIASPDPALTSLFAAVSPSVVVSENLLRVQGKATDDSIDLVTPSGTRSFRIVGAVRDFTFPHGVIYLRRRDYRRYWGDPLVSTFSLHLLPGADAERVRAEIQRRFPGRNLQVLLSGELRDGITAAVRQGFAFSRRLQLLVLLVVLFGLVDSMWLAAIERTSELGVLRALGMTRRRLFFLSLREGALLGTLGSAVGAAFGAALAALWLGSALRDLWGWRIELSLPWLTLAAALAAAIAASLVASLYPGWLASRLDIRRALTAE